MELATVVTDLLLSVLVVVAVVVVFDSLQVKR
jgi:hypothetical protein